MCLQSHSRFFFHFSPKNDDPSTPLYLLLVFLKFLTFVDPFMIENNVFLYFSLQQCCWKAALHSDNVSLVVNEDLNHIAPNSLQYLDPQKPWPNYFHNSFVPWLEIFPVHLLETVDWQHHTWKGKSQKTVHLWDLNKYPQHTWLQTYVQIPR